MNLSATLERLCSLSTEAAEVVPATLYRKHPGLRETIGPRGVAACRTDIGYHIEYLCAALVAGHSTPFVEYANWLSLVLRSRQIRDDVLGESFSLLADFLAVNLQTDEAEAVAKIMADGRASLGSHPALPGISRLMPETLSSDAKSYLDSLLADDRKTAASSIIERQREGSSLVTLETRVIQPAMYEVGNLWQKNLISVAQEHLATAISQAVMAEAFSQAEFAEPNGHRALFANIEANHHALGLRMVADAFETSGWETRCLGTNVPSATIISQIDAMKPDLIGISASLPSQFVALSKLIEMVTAEFGQQRPFIMLGGLAINSMPGIAEHLRADISAADAEAACRIAAEFRPSKND
jgi:methanogenic corrinoid protein MtbC1